MMLYYIIKGGDDVNVVKKKLRKVMIEKGFSVKRLSEETGITQSQASRLLNGHYEGKITWWRKVAEVLGCEIGDIVE